MIEIGPTDDVDRIAGVAFRIGFLCGEKTFREVKRLVRGIGKDLQTTSASCLKILTNFACRPQISYQ